MVRVQKEHAFQGETHQVHLEEQPRSQTVWAEERMAKQRAGSFSCLGSTMAIGHDDLAINGIDSGATPKPAITTKDC